MSDTFEYHCRMCQEDKKVTVRIEHEYGEFGSVLSSWPEFDVEPPCLGFVGGESDSVDFMQKVTPDMDVDFERCAERCSFQYEEAWDNPDGAWVLGMNQERGRQQKALAAALEALEEAQGKLEAVSACLPPDGGSPMVETIRAILGESK